MYFVTTNRPGYILFSMTPSERAAVGLTDEQIVRLLVRDATGEEWVVVEEWNTNDYSHTDFMAALHRIDEPADPKDLLRFLPARARKKP